MSRQTFNVQSKHVIVKGFHPLCHFGFLSLDFNLNISIVNSEGFSLIIVAFNDLEKVEPDFCCLFLTNNR